MKLLLDSQALIWALYDDHGLIGPNASQLLIARDTQLLVSAASVWELGLKHSKRKDRQPYSIDQLLQGVTILQASLLEVNAQHLKLYGSVVLPQKDPFDRMLVAQAQAEGCTFLTSNQHILTSNYNVLDVRL